MNKKISAALIALVLFFTVSLQPKRAEAISGLATGIIPMAVVGGALLAVSAGGITIYGFTNSYGCSPLTLSCERAGNPPAILAPFGALFADVLAGLGILVGVALLDDSTPSFYQFTSITAENGAKMGLTPFELTEWNDRLDELNAVRETISMDLSAKAPSDVPLDAKEALRLATDEWQSFEVNGALTPAQVSAFKKIATSYSVKAGK